MSSARARHIPFWEETNSSRCPRPCVPSLLGVRGCDGLVRFRSCSEKKPFFKETESPCILFRENEAFFLHYGQISHGFQPFSERHARLSSIVYPYLGAKTANSVGFTSSPFGVVKSLHLEISKRSKKSGRSSNDAQDFSCTYSVCDALTQVMSGVKYFILTKEFLPRDSHNSCCSSFSSSPFFFFVRHNKRRSH